MTIRRSATLAPASSTLLSASALAQTIYAAKSVSVIVPFAAGGNPDVATSLVATSMSRTLGQPLVIDNKEAGAGGAVGHRAGARAPFDGYTITATAKDSFVVTPKLQARIPFKRDDLTPVGSIAVKTLVFEVAAGSRFRSMSELLAFAGANPQQVSVGHSGNGSTNHVAILPLQEAAQANLTSFPTRVRHGR